MSLSAVAAVFFAGCMALPLAMHAALVLGAPFGRYTMGGRWPGRLPLRLRGLPAIQGALLVAMALAILTAAGLTGFGWPRWTAWLALGVTALSCLANWATPSIPERRLWGPVITLALLAGLVALLAPA